MNSHTQGRVTQTHKHTHTALRKYNTLGKLPNHRAKFPPLETPHHLPGWYHIEKGRSFPLPFWHRTSCRSTHFRVNVPDGRFRDRPFFGSDDTLRALSEGKCKVHLGIYVYVDLDLFLFLFLSGSFSSVSSFFRLLLMYDITRYPKSHFLKQNAFHRIF